uniref:Uncharacterized protein n=1 Tax=Rhizophora mucronata TaxID=61149 RepID=A0A2P2NCZ1_RHIMU
MPFETTPPSFLASLSISSLCLVTETPILWRNSWLKKAISSAWSSL